MMPDFNCSKIESYKDTWFDMFLIHDKLQKYDSCLTVIFFKSTRFNNYVEFKQPII